MKKQKERRRQVFPHFVNIVTIALIIECFLCSILAVNRFGRQNCFDRIEEATKQLTQMFKHSMDDNQQKLTVFADVLAINRANTDEFLNATIENFCQTQDFNAICIHRADGSRVTYGFHDHGAELKSFEEETRRLPYTSDVIVDPEDPQKRYVYQAVPIVRENRTVAVLYGYISLDSFPGFVEATSYSGQCQLYIVDGWTGEFLMNEHYDQMPNIYEESAVPVETKDGFDTKSMRDNIYHGKSGYYVFRAPWLSEWHYTYYMPIGVNNWSMQMTIDEGTAFASYYDVSRTIISVAVLVVVLIFVHVVTLMFQNGRVKRKDQAQLEQSRYVAEIQRTLLNAHANPDVISQALRIVAEEMQAQTMLLLSLSGMTIHHVHYWPSGANMVAKTLMERNIREDFLELYDELAANRSIQYVQGGMITVSDGAKAYFKSRGMHDALLVPVMDNAGHLKGVLCAANLKDISRTAEMMECVTYDFYMTLTNVENLEIIQNLATVDYMTSIKNRNSYEAEVTSFATMECESLWCIFIDVNALHIVNNTQGHKAGDLMLCTVADVVRRLFGRQYTYRIGGDEFLAFACDSTEEEFAAKKKEIAETLARKGYQVSIGYKGTTKNEYGEFEVERILAEAEEIMYNDKKKFYTENNVGEDRGRAPRWASAWKTP